MSRPEGAAPVFEGISPVFPVADVAAALAFYRERLGFDIGWTWGDPPTHANLCRGNIDISLVLNPEKAGSGEAYVGLRGVDAYFTELRSRNVPAATWLIGPMACRILPSRIRAATVSCSASRSPNSYGDSISGKAVARARAACRAAVHGLARDEGGRISSRSAFATARAL